MISNVVEILRTNKKNKNLEEFVVKLQKRISEENLLHTLFAPNEKDAMTSRGKQEMKYDVPPGECTLCDRSCR